MTGFVFEISAARVTIVAAALVASLCGGAAGAELPRLSVMHRFQPNDPVHQALEQLRKDLATVVSIDVNAARSDYESVQGMFSGSTDATVVSPPALQETIRVLALLDLIGLWRDRAHWGRALDTEPGREMSALVERAKFSIGIQVLGWWGGTRRHILTRRDGVPKIENFKGLRLQIPLDPMRSKMWKALGVQPVPQVLPELTAMLRDGTVEGIDEEAGVMVQSRLFEVASHLTETGHTITTRLFIIAKPAWQRLTAVQQTSVTAAARKAGVLARAAEQEHESSTLHSLKERFGVRFHTFAGQDDLVARTRSFRARYAEELGVSHVWALIEKSAKP